MKIIRAVIEDQLQFTDRGTVVAVRRVSNGRLENGPGKEGVQLPLPCHGTGGGEFAVEIGDAGQFDIPVSRSNRQSSPAFVP